MSLYKEISKQKRKKIQRKNNNTREEQMQKEANYKL